MAKKKSKQVVSSFAKKKNSTVVDIKIGDGKGLSPYSPYVSTPNFTLFFERPSSDFDSSLFPLPHMYALNIGFSLVTDGSKLIDVEFAKQIARLFINYLNAETVSKHICSSTVLGAQYFIKFIGEKYPACQRIEDLNFQIFYEVVNCQTKDIAAYIKKFLVRVLSRHPYIKTFEGRPSDIRLPQKQKINIENVDFDSLTDEKSYSDKEMSQILTYCIYEIEKMKSHFDAINTVTEESLGDDYIGVEIKVRGVKGITAKVSQFFEDENYEAIYKNMLYSAQRERAGKAIENPPIASRISAFIGNKANRKGIDCREQYETFKAYVCRHYGPLGDNSNWIKSFKLMDKQPSSLVALYAMIATGKNKESILSLKRNYGNVPWYEHYDKYLGVSYKTSRSQKVVRLIGKKQKGKVVKDISIRVPINSALFSYLKLLDNILNAPDREFFFNDEKTLKLNFFFNEFFLKAYPVFSDDGKAINSLDTRKLRKTFVGNLLMKAIDVVKDGESLVTKMQQALNHKSFDTTFHSYIMKTGTASHIIDASLVTLTSDMLNKALHFQGRICKDAEQKTSSKLVYLCECTDDTKPTHGIPIAERCKKYDMCLGCERSEVYSHHIKNIWYRTMQYDAIAAENPLTFSGLLADRRQVAHDTIARFRCEHPNGEWFADTAFEEATQAFNKGDILVPPVTQF